MPMHKEILKLINSHALISDQIDRRSLYVVLENLEKVLANGVPGDIAEFGCYSGTTSLFISRLLLKRAEHSRQFHVYDSFEGLPAKSNEDEGSVGHEFQEGKLQVSKKDFIRNYHKAGLPLPIIHKGWFEDLTDQDVPGKLAFTFLDGDFYDSIYQSLQLSWPRLSRGGVLCIDDYMREALPGVAKAISKYFGTEIKTIKHANIGIITKP